MNQWYEQELVLYFFTQEQLSEDGIQSAYPWFELHGLNLFTPLENNPEYSHGWQYLYQVNRNRQVKFNDDKNEIYPI